MIERIEIGDLAFGGDGVGRLNDGKVVFVYGSVPGDVAEIEIVGGKKSHAFGRIKRLIEPSEHRVEPGCPVAGVCGGCSWRHVDYSFQTNWKETFLRRELGRVIKNLDDDAVKPIVPSQPSGFRVRARLHYRGDRFGTMAANSHQVVSFERCPILDGPLEAFARQLGEKLEDLRPADTDFELYVDAEDRRGLQEIPLSRNSAGQKEIEGDLTAALNCVHVLAEETGDEKISFEPGVFVQTNRQINQQLVQTVCRLSGEGETFAEIYSGCGNFTVHLVKRFYQGVASEKSRAAIKHLAKNLSGRRVEIRAESDAASARFLSKHPPVDCLVVDPPRAGIKPLYTLFENSPPRRLVMVSCHPMAAIRDIGRLVERFGYRLIEITPLDMFPHTSHFEVAALLVRN